MLLNDPIHVTQRQLGDTGTIIKDKVFVRDKMKLQHPVAKCVCGHTRPPPLPHTMKRVSFDSSCSHIKQRLKFPFIIIP